MAIRISFEGWVNEIKPTEWGAFVSVSHEKRAKNPATDAWETIGRDYIDVSVPTELLKVVQDNKLVAVVGNGSVEAYLSNAGEPKARFKVRALEITPVERRGDAEVSPQLNTGLAPRAWVPNDANLAATLGATPVDEEAPF